MVVPAAAFFSTPELRRGAASFDVLVHGPAHLFRPAWLAGARDYLRAPWSADELFLRLRGPSPSWMEWDASGQVCRMEGSRLSRGTEVVTLSGSEVALLRILVQRRGTPVSRAILGWVAGCSEGRVIDTLVGRIRKKLQKLGAGDQGLVAVRGLGYRLP